MLPIFSRGVTQMDLIKGQISEGVYAPVKLDGSSHGLMTLDDVHYYAHQGKFFRAGFDFVLSNGQVAALSFDTPNTLVNAHVYAELNATADGTFEWIEDCTSVSGGLALPPLNHHRELNTASAMVLTAGYTGNNLPVPVGGTTLLTVTLGVGRGTSIVRDNAVPFIFKQDSIYLFRYTNGTSSNDVHLILEWYEHTDN
jgi:hypothetical protein